MQQAKLIDKKGKPILVNPPVYPYMWKECVGDQADPDVSPIIVTALITYIFDEPLQ